MKLNTARPRLIYAVIIIICRIYCPDGAELERDIQKPVYKQENYCYQDIADGACKRSYCHAALRVFELIHIHRHGLCPAEVEHDHHYKTHDVKVLYGVERQASGVLCRIVAQLIGHEAVAQFMERDADERGYDAEKYIEQVCEIKAVPNGFKCVNLVHLRFSLYFNKNICK